MVPGRSHGAKSVFQFSGQHRVGGRQRGTSGAQGGVPSVSIERGIGVNLRVRRTTRCNLVAQTVAQAAQRRHMQTVVRELNISQRRRGRLTPLQHLVQS